MADADERSHSGGDPGPGRKTTIPEEAGPRISTATIERSAWSLVWLAVIVGGLGFWGAWSAWPPSTVLAPLMVLVGIAGMAAAWLVPSPRSLVLQLAALASVVGATFGPQAVSIHLRQFYSTDSGAFNQAAARLLLNGKNPYTSTMASAARLLQHPADNWTYTVSGGYVNHVSYPAGSFLLPLPALALGFNHAVVDWMDLFAWIVAGVLIFALLDAPLRWIGCLLMSVPIFTAIFGSGGTDAAFLPFMVLAVWAWDRFPRGRAGGVVRWMGPIALGLACSIKQTPWFCLPFLLLGVFIEARNAGRRPLRPTASYLAVVVTTFLAVNLPFIVWQPGAWVHGTFLPFAQPLVADGQGLVTLVLHGFAHGVSLPLLTAAGLLVFISLLASFVAAYPVMKRIWLILLPLSFFFATRSLSSYLLDLYPAALVAAVSVAPGVAPAMARRRSRSRAAVIVAAAGSALAAVVVSALAFTTVPLQLAIRGASASPDASTLYSVTLAMHNTTDQVVSPHFMVTISSDHPDGFWLPADGRQVVLQPHASAVMTLYPSHPTGAPGHNGYWLVAGYTDSPEALSTSPVQRWHLGSSP
ncbi:MAG: hypothetical protein ACRDYE_02280 [Acidimicrobiales bacterium]